MGDNKTILPAFLLLGFVVCNVLGQQLTTQVDVPVLGTIQGYTALTSRDTTQFWAFIGIPYADPASYMGLNRFQPSKLWSGPLTENGEIFYANRTLSICPQRAIIDLPPTEVQNLEAVYRSTSKSKRFVKKLIRESNGVGEAKRAMSLLSKHWGVEDCLTLNINTKNIPNDPETDELVPIIVFFHGGGSDSIWGSAFTGQRLLEEKVVLITLNYRLGSLGAFNLGNDESPGNQAMYDAIVALEWIKEYGKYFGGDPEKVTITGQSAGSMMVTHLLLSPMAAGLFHGVWGFSGSALNIWGTAEHSSLRHHLDVAHYAGCHDRDGPAPDEHKLKEISVCMRDTDLQNLVEALDLYEWQETSQGRLGYDARVPSIQSPSLNHPIFLSEDPINIIKNWAQSPVPLVLGATRHDGSYPIEDIYNDFLVPNGYHENATFIKNEMVPLLLNTMGIYDTTGGLSHSFAHNYFGEAIHSDKLVDKIPGMIDMSTVLGFKGGQYKMVEYQAKLEPNSYFYSFDYKGRWTLYNILNDFDMYVPGGISHTDDLLYYFFIFPIFNDDMRVSRRVVNYFVNFATYGNPNGNVTEAGGVRGVLERNQVYWEPYNDMKHPYLVINRKDRVKYDCPDSWIGAALELVTPEIEDPSSTTEAEITDSPVEPTQATTEDIPVSTTESGALAVLNQTTYLWIIVSLALFCKVHCC